MFCARGAGSKLRAASAGATRQRHIQNQPHFAAAQNGRAANAAQMAEQSPKGLDDRLELPVQTIHHQADLMAGVLHHHHALPRRRLAIQLELIAQTQEMATPRRAGSDIPGHNVLGSSMHFHHGVQRHNEIVIADRGQGKPSIMASVNGKADDKARAPARFCF